MFDAVAQNFKNEHPRGAVLLLNFKKQIIIIIRKRIRPAIASGNVNVKHFCRSVCL